MDASEYQAIPFLPGGRTRAGCDCYGLVRLVLSERFGKILPSYSDAYDGIKPEESVPAARAIMEGVATDRVEDPREGDIAMMRLGGHLCHCGIFVDEKHVLHTDHATGPVIDDITRPRLYGRLEGVYRVR